MSLLFLNNQRIVPAKFRNRWFHSILLGITTLVSVVLGGNELYRALSPLWGGGA